MRRMPSSSIKLPCSTEATPARTARLIASAPWACAATLRPHIAASSTIAFSSSCEYCGAPTDSSSESTPALASTLMRSAPYFTSKRIFSRIWKYGADLIKVLASAGVLSEEESVGAPQYSQEELNAVVQEAAMWGKKVAAHAHGA